MRFFCSYLCAIAAIFAFPTLSNAAVSFTSTAFDSGPATNQIMVDNFDSAPAAGYTVTGGMVLAQSNYAVAVEPAGDTSTFMAANSGNSVTLKSAVPMASLSVYLGSLDTYNSITFLGAGGFDETLTGSQLVSFASGNQTSGATNRRFFFDFGSTPVNEVIFASAGNSLEFDNVAAAPVPEPSTWAFMIAGVATLGGLAWRRRRQGANSPAPMSPASA